MRILKKIISVLVLVFFVASLTAGSASAGNWKNNYDYKDSCDWGCKDKCDYKDKCGHKDKCCHKDKCDCDFDFEAFFGGSFFECNYFLGNDCFFGLGDNWLD